MKYLGGNVSWLPVQSLFPKWWRRSNVCPHKVKLYNVHELYEQTWNIWELCFIFPYFFLSLFSHLCLLSGYFWAQFSNLNPPKARKSIFWSGVVIHIIYNTCPADKVSIIFFFLNQPNILLWRGSYSLAHLDQ